MPIARIIPQLAALALLVLPHQGASAAEIVDATGRAVTINNPQRIVAIGGSITEIVYALGEQQRIVARDTTSFYPEAATAKPDVGYMRALSPEGVLAMRPDLILALEGSGPPAAMDILKSASVPIVIVPDHFTVAGIEEKIRMVAAVLDKPAEGEKLAAKVADDFAAVEAAVAKVPHRKTVIFVMSTAGGRALAAGGKTAADGIITLAGAVNGMAGYDGYKQASDEAITGARPQFVLGMRGGAEELTPEKVFSMPAFAATPAAEGKHLVVMDGLYLLGYGPRTAMAVRDLASTLYPELGLGKSEP
jgi:iron complex transport system substrate-binding protein